MDTTAIKRPSPGFTTVKSSLAAVAFVAGSVVSTRLCHLLPQGGPTLLPVFFFTLIAAYACGWRVGLLTAIVSPLLDTLLFGLPAAAALPVILVKSIILTFAAEYAATHFRYASLWAIAGVVVTYQCIGTAFEWAVVRSFQTAVQDLRTGLPGIVLQWIGGWSVIKFAINP